MSTEINGIELYLNDFATKSFLHVGDQDYITARLCYQNGLMLQFHWSSSQAIEKYFKAILLYHRVPSLDCGHKLVYTYNKITQIEGLDFHLTTKQQAFLKHLDSSGDNRYMTRKYEYMEYEIVELDNLVWTVRGYCTAEVSNQFQAGERSDALASLKSKLALNSRITLPHGYLEKVLADKKSQQRSALLWNNLYFGRKRKSVKLLSRWETNFPTHFMYPEMIERLFKFVHFSGPEQDKLNKERDAMRKKRPKK